MTRNKIYAIVEGQGEANRPAGGERPAVIVLISKMLYKLECWTLFPNEKIAPFRMSYGNFFRNDKLEKAIRYHKMFADCAALLVLLDMDDDCPKEKAQELTKRINDIETLPFSVVVVCAKREYEAWFLASLETIHTGHVFDDDPETKRNAKGWLRKNFAYKPTQQQAVYTRKLDIDLVHHKSRSFRRLYHAFQEIIEANQKNKIIVTPLP